eukprot:TRINITY_DN10510_c0_g1_i1.p1 TRINITY_DN10510_c0_g1~~TRINITY_DN10510_c0_g1_i1.p1  ORF type:complete len:236 (-),score=44.17 TRINITY_DN10510_c0_g1_i1:119-826(-)
MTSQPTRVFGNFCSTPQCCEGTNCGKTPTGQGLFPFSAANDWPANPNAPPGVLGCVQNRSQIQPPNIVYGPNANADSNSACPDYAGLGGDETMSFFEMDPDVEFMFAFVVDRTGVWTYRWKSTDEQFANSIWPGIRKYGVDKTLAQTKPAKKPTDLTPPCEKDSEFCVMMHPVVSDDGACLLAGSNGDASSVPGQFAWATLNNQNWWNLFEDSGQASWNYSPSILPKTKRQQQRN